MRAIAAAAAVSALTLSVQNPTVVDRRPLRSSVELTVVTATVRDADGRLVTGLPRGAFEIYEDGDRQSISQFTNERVPVGLGLLLDISDSMFGRRIVEARGAVERFLLELLKPTDAFFVMAFNHEPRMLTAWTNDPSTVREALDGLKPWGGTAIYDAIIRAEPMLHVRTRERAALVVISDGADTASDATLREVRSTVLRTDAFIYAVAIDAADRRPINTRVNPEALQEITNQSGGTTEIVRDSSDLDGATARIAEELNSQYVLGYSPSHGADGRYHSIRVKMVDPAYRVRARNGYVASPRP
jgi:VWFA-related protein